MKRNNLEGTPRKRVLILDDERSITEMLQSILEPRYEVDTLNDSREALELILTVDFDLIISDIMMPHLNGIELYHEVKKRRPGTEKRMLFMSGLVNEQYKVVLETTGNLFLAKPFSLVGFMEAVNRFFTVRQLKTTCRALCGESIRPDVAAPFRGLS